MFYYFIFQMERKWWRVLAKCGPLEKRMQTTSVFLPWNIMNNMESENDRTLKGELPRSVGAQYATGDQWRNNSRKNEEKEPKQKQHLVADVPGDGSKVQGCKEQYCVGT